MVAVLPNRLQLFLLTDGALDQIEHTAYRLLEEVGISLQHEGAQRLLHDLGCRIDQGRTFIPRPVVQWALERVRPHRSHHNRDGSPAFAFGDGQIRFHNSGGPPFIYDIHTGERRLSILEDVAHVTRVLDALPNVDVVIPLFGPQDVPPELLTVASTAAVLRNTRKPSSSAAIEKPEHVSYVVEIAAASCGGMMPSVSIPTCRSRLAGKPALHHDVTAAIWRWLKRCTIPLAAPRLWAPWPRSRWRRPGATAPKC
jgi:trimethylamine:corrinoid methyltransferase-like protein